VNKKKQKNFWTWDTGWGDGIATCKRQRKKIYASGQRLRRQHSHTHPPEEQKFFGSFFQKRTASS
jgi:hypothetical protein